MKNQMTILGDIQREKSSFNVREMLTRYGSESVGIRDLVCLMVGIGSERLDTLLDGLELNEILKMTLPELEQRTSKAVAAKLFALGEIVRRQRCLEPKKMPVIYSPSDVSELLMGEMRLLEQEELRIILLSAKNHVLSIENVSKGTVNSFSVHPREVFRSAIKKACAFIIMVHNHPSGDCEPSREDILITQRIVEAGKIVGIDVLDHIIIGDGRFMSLKEREILCELKGK